MIMIIVVIFRDRMNRIRCYEDYEDHYEPYVTSCPSETP